MVEVVVDDGSIAEQHQVDGTTNQVCFMTVRALSSIKLMAASHSGGRRNWQLASYV
jgi:hypothetical protein